MVQNPGKKICTDTIKPVNLPELIQVEVSASGDPVAVKTPRHQTVLTIDDRWRIDDEWWREEPISRFYYIVHLSSGQRLAIYRDLISSQWYKQAY
jgi:hypothetical protein